MQIKRLLRDGFNGGRRGGDGARGNFRTDQLVALSEDQKKEGIRLGTTSDDEDGGDGSEKKNEEENSDDELDQAIKYRYLSSLPSAATQEPSDESEEEEVAPGK